MQTVIVADDDAMFRKIMTRHLGAMGFAVIEDESGKQVAAQIGQYRPVACLIDILMDEKEGIETITEIAQLPLRPKVIAVSSNAFYLEIASELGADATLQKPIALETLKATLERLEIRPE
jgi:CheY-like chemotaxis protein